MAASDHIKKGKQAFINQWNIGIFGFPGVGKTVLAARAPNSLLIEIDPNGHMVLRNHPDLEDADWVYLGDFEKVGRFLEALPRDKEYFDSLETIILDTVTELRNLNALSLIDGDPLYDKKWEFNQHIWTQNNVKVMKMVGLALSLKKNLILNMHMREDTKKKGNKETTVVRPDLGGALTAQLFAKLDGVFYYKQEGVVRRLVTAPNSELMTKSRFTTKGFDNPDFRSDVYPWLERYKKSKES